MSESPKKQLKEELAEQYLNDNYSFQFNTVLYMPQYRKLGEEKYKVMDDYTLNSIKRELYTRVGILISTGGLKEILSSDFVEKVDPFAEYFKSLPAYDHKDYISQLADTVKTTNQDKWKLYLRKWMIATVANAITEKNCQNHTCIILTGEQGKFKTTWLDLLCPPDLYEYLYTGKIDPNNKDVQALLAECFIINVDDQFKQLNKKEENDVKELITKPFIKFRRPYGVYNSQYPRRASFVGSINGNDFLTDPTGSRRFLPFEVLSIDIDKAKKIDIDKPWAQAYFLFKQNERYWFNDEEIAELIKDNQSFQMTSLEEQFILEYFAEPYTAGKSPTHYLQPASVLSYLENMTHIRLSQKKLGEALTKLKFRRTRKVVNGSGQYVYHMIQLNPADVDTERTRSEERTRYQEATAEYSQYQEKVVSEVEMPF